MSYREIVDFVRTILRNAWRTWPGKATIARNAIIRTPDNGAIRVGLYQAMDPPIRPEPLRSYVSTIPAVAVWSVPEQLWFCRNDLVHAMMEGVDGAHGLLLPGWAAR